MYCITSGIVVQLFSSFPIKNNRRKKRPRRVCGHFKLTSKSKMFSLNSLCGLSMKTSSTLRPVMMCLYVLWSYRIKSTQLSPKHPNLCLLIIFSLPTELSYFSITQSLIFSRLWRYGEITAYVQLNSLDSLFTSSSIISVDFPFPRLICSLIDFNDNSGLFIFYISNDGRHFN